MRRSTASQRRQLYRSAYGLSRAEARLIIVDADRPLRELYHDVLRLPPGLRLLAVRQIRRRRDVSPEIRAALRFMEMHRTARSWLADVEERAKWERSTVAYHDDGLSDYGTSTLEELEDELEEAIEHRRGRSRPPRASRPRPLQEDDAACRATPRPASPRRWPSAAPRRPSTRCLPR